MTALPQEILIPADAPDGASVGRRSVSNPVTVKAEAFEVPRQKRLLERSGIRAWISFVLLLTANTIQQEGFGAILGALQDNLTTIVELGLVALGLSASSSVTTKPVKHSKPKPKPATATGALAASVGAGATLALLAYYTMRGLS